MHSLREVPAPCGRIDALAERLDGAPNAYVMRFVSIACGADACPQRCTAR
jgi:hypothetical protein